MTHTIEAAVQLRSSGRAEQARTMLLELLSADDSNAGLLYQLAWTHDVLGLEREAVSYYEQSLLNELREKMAGSNNV
ncbi:hypothetical protein [Paenibacillus sp. FSL H3-0469]|uniref:hypothetical protein n=1 Tax=Paenibacillus sp. FSL H3-0469 TaxID=2954506 RepID=UPI0031017ABF